MKNTSHMPTPDTPEASGISRRTVTKAAKIATAATAAVAGIALGLTGAAPAFAAPAPATVSFTGSAYAGTVPEGACAVTITAVGGGGGNMFGFHPLLAGIGSAGANITATYPVRPGMPVDITVGGGGAMTSNIDDTLLIPGGYPDGGTSGATPTNEHRGAAGGGSTSVSIDGLELIVAGGGGGLGGGHSNIAVGGDAGLPVASGVTAGMTGGSARSNTSEPTYSSGGGQGGQVTGPGAGGVLTAPGLDQAFIDSHAGLAGVGRVGGTGGYDTSLDSGGGGGGGFYGGGGGSGTDRDHTQGPSVDPGNVGGGGGGGGASYVSELAPAGLGSVSGITSIHGDRANRSQAGPNGLVTLTWMDCGIVTDNGSTTAVEGLTQRWAPSPTNEGTGAPETAAIELIDGSGNPLTEIVIPGVGTYTVDGVEIVFTPDAAFVGTPAPASYRATSVLGSEPSTFTSTATGTYSPTVTATPVDPEPDPAPIDPEPTDPAPAPVDSATGTATGTSTGTSSKMPGSLAATGSETALTGWVAGAAGLLAAGLGALVMARRRRGSFDDAEIAGPAV